MCQITNFGLYLVFMLLTNNEYNSCSPEYQLLEHIVNVYEEIKYGDNSEQAAAIEEKINNIFTGPKD